ncbi:hypothetical protein BJ912DRAFT_935264 [Pholiota molesta]|nr:hypothetical protein BJ912DRAFT_935264 [Pholiota molesta]
MAVSMLNINNTVSPSEAEFVVIAHNLMAVKYYSLASFGELHAVHRSLIMLFYDIMITFGDEVDQIWKRKFTKFTPLWFLLILSPPTQNRYLSPLGFIVITASIFVIRLYATYSSSRFIALPMTCLLLLELALKIWSFTSGQRLQLPPGLVGCILTTGPDSFRFTFTWIAELIFDSIVFILTLWRTFSLNLMRGGGTRSLINLILRDALKRHLGVIYFAVILAANLFTVLTFLLAPPNLKAINASFTVA